VRGCIETAPAGSAGGPSTGWSRRVEVPRSGIWCQAEAGDRGLACAATSWTRMSHEESRERAAAGRSTSSNMAQLPATWREVVVVVGSLRACCERIQQKTFGINEGIAMESVSARQASSALRLWP